MSVSSGGRGLAQGNPGPGGVDLGRGQSRPGSVSKKPAVVRPRPGSGWKVFGRVWPRPGAGSQKFAWVRSRPRPGSELFAGVKPRQGSGAKILVRVTPRLGQGDKILPVSDLEWSTTGPGRHKTICLFFGCIRVYRYTIAVSSGGRDLATGNPGPEVFDSFRGQPRPVSGSKKLAGVRPRWSRGEK